MARQVATVNLESRDVRRKLKARGRPYYRAVERDVHIGYRRNRPGITGSWSTRRYLGEGRYDEAQLGAADDIHDADGKAVLNYWQAVKAARDRAGIEPDRTGPFTVEDAVNDYVEFLNHNRRTGYDVRVRMAAHVLPVLGRISVDKLTTEKLRKWHAALVKQLPRLRTKPGYAQQHRTVANDDEAVRKRRVSANRCLAQLKAARNPRLR